MMGAVPTEARGMNENGCATPGKVLRAARSDGKGEERGRSLASRAGRYGHRGHPATPPQATKGISHLSHAGTRRRSAAGGGRVGEATARGSMTWWTVRFCWSEGCARARARSWCIHAYSGSV